MRVISTIGFVGCGALLVAACQGRGSDIGPRLEPVPSVSSKVSVLDDQNRGVVGAVVELVGSTTRAVSGRNGRGDLFASPSGRLLVRVDGAAAAAADGDSLGAFTVAVPTAGGDLPVAFHLPTFGAAQSVTTGVATANFSIALGGGRQIDVAAGTTVASVGSGAAVDVRGGELQAEHLPGDLPFGNAVLFGAGVLVGPADLIFAPPADLVVPDDLLATGNAALYRLSPSTGEWVTVGNGTASGGAITAAGAIGSGGLYAFGVTVIGGAVRGRVLDVDGRSVPDALVCVDGRWTTSRGDGRFDLTGMPATYGDGSARDAVIEVFSGGQWLPMVATATVTMNGAAEVDVGDITLDTTPCCNIRMQHVKRARAEPFRPARLSTLYDNVALTASCDADGQVTFEDVPQLWFGFQDAYPRDDVFTNYAQAVGYVGPGARWLEAYQFYDKLPWFHGSRSSRIVATDAIGGGPLYEAVFMRGANPGGGYFGRTRESGTIYAERSLEELVTGTYFSERDNEIVVHAFSIVDPDGEHLEMPLRQVLRQPLGAFDRHGIAAGAIVGADTGKQHRLRATRRLEVQEWWAQAFHGVPIRSSLPIDVDPATTHDSFRCGVDATGGHIAVVELVDPPGTATAALQKVGIAADWQPVEGSVQALDITLTHAATAAFTASGALAANAGFATDELSFDLALEQPSSRVIDIATGIDGNHVVNGDDITLTLPPLSGALADHAWLAAVSGSTTAGGESMTQRCLLRFDGVTASPGAFLALPSITAPAVNAAVDSAGFTVQFTLPVAAQYATLELRSETVGETLLWNIYLPPTATEFAFVTLPIEATSPLEPGKNYQLTLAAYAAAGGALANAENPYRRLTTYLQSIGEAERGVVAMSAHTIQISTN